MRVPILSPDEVKDVSWGLPAPPEMEPTLCCRPPQQVGVQRTPGPLIIGSSPVSALGRATPVKNRPLSL